MEDVEDTGDRDGRRAAGDAAVRSEVGRLREVLVHRPGEELRRITPTNKDELLFDELLWVERAQEEHDAFVDRLTEAGVTVVALTDLLGDVLADPDLARDTVRRQVTERTCGPQAVERIRAFLLDRDPADLAAHLIGGVGFDEVAPGDGLVAAATPPTGMWLAPLPNAVFTRDSSAWIGRGVVVAPMNRLARRRETDLLRLVYTTHERFAGAPIWFGERGDVEYFPATVEGGDVLVLDERAIAVGLSERTTPAGVETLATRLFAADAVDRVLAVQLPQVRSAMHLDTVVTQVDRAAFLVYPALRPTVETWRVTRDPGTGPGRVVVRPGGNLLEGLAWATGRDDLRAIEPELSSTRAAREQWNDANNTLAVAPGEVVAYERNVATNDTLATAGITVHTIPSYELPRGRGGPRCMTCPLRRDPL